MNFFVPPKSLANKAGKLVGTKKNQQWIDYCQKNAKNR
jgi:hypothetical protein